MQGAQKAMSAALSIETVKSQASGLSYRNQAFIGGQFVAAASGKTFDCVSPIDGKVLTQVAAGDKEDVDRAVRSEEHTSELQSLMRISYAVFCLQKKKHQTLKIA